jgi:hypothetical protein
MPLVLAGNVCQGLEGCAGNFSCEVRNEQAGHASERDLLSAANVGEFFHIHAEGQKCDVAIGHGVMESAGRDDQQFFAARATQEFT